MAAVAPTGVKPRALDANVYATKKSVAQGMLDVALLTANASQLKYLLRVGDRHDFYYPMMVLVCLSIVLQICVGVVILVKSRFSINDVNRQSSAEKLNDALVWLIFATTVVNAFLSVFGIEPVSEIAVGGIIVVLGSTDLNQQKNHRKADVLNNVVTIFIFFISILNILISAFGMQETDQLVI